MYKTIGVLAHVDAGKTTLSEQLLYHGGALRTRGRVDHGDAFLDTDPVERARGITVFAGQASFTHGGDVYQLVDTPGHADFAAGMERTLAILDAAILVVSAPDGVQGHTETIWRRLEALSIPTFVFLNKCDRCGPAAALGEIRARLSDDCVDLDGACLCFAYGPFPRKPGGGRFQRPGASCAWLFCNPVCAAPFSAY
ncbi:GTP-binding protein [Intestinibacillus massiliensis]|uniref:GTP-binding protein n=1 Tax=Intestinibacillus massiliensis TaxID=1871029 RepID=UPI000B35AB1E|nr:GTP-binding protein [Intestinibacillus massiliensis]